MKKITLTDKRCFYISDDKYEPLMNALKDSGIIEITSITGQEYAFSSFAFFSAEKATGQEAANLVPEKNRIESGTTEISDEQREKNLEKIAKMKADFLNKRDKKNEKLQKTK